MMLRLPVLTLSPVLGLISGMVFTIKAGILTGTFYVQAAALFLTAGIMALRPDFGLTILAWYPQPASLCLASSIIASATA